MKRRRGERVRNTKEGREDEEHDGGERGWGTRRRGERVRNTKEGR